MTARRNSAFLFCPLLLGLFVAGPAALGDELSDSEQRLLESAKYLASDDLEGRGLTTKGINLAADYIAKEFRKLGLKTEVFDGSPFQKFTVVTSAKLGKGNDVALVNAAGKSLKLDLGKNYTPMGIGGSGKLGLPLVFAGYGISAKENDYDDYAGVDVKGKAVILLRKEPQQANPHSKFDGTKSSRHAVFTRKISNAYQHGASAVILVNDQHGIDTRVKSAQRRLDRDKKALADFEKQLGDNKPAKKQAVRLKQLQDAVKRSEQRLAAERDPLMQFRTAGLENSRNIPVITVRRALIDPLVKAALGKDLATLEKEIDKGPKPQSRQLKGCTLVGQVDVERTKTEIKNVAAVLPGRGALAEETVVIGAHYDHLGYGGRGSLTPNRNEIHNGADDNGSGTAALLEVAHDLVELRKSEPDKPARRVMFIAFTGEERGLLGSSHYVANPALPMDKTVAMLNMDMVGRLNDNKLIVQGVDTSKEFGPLLDKLNKTYDFKLIKKKGGQGPSDHTSFYLKKVPVMHFFTGTHKDYHRPSDDFDKLNVPGMRRIGELVAHSAWQIATAPKRPSYVKVAGGQFAGGGGDRPYLGSIPDFASEGNGYKLMGVTKNGPAANAGMKAGDAIIQLGKYKIANLQDIDGALRKFKGGDKVKVVVLRDGKKVTLTVTLGEPR